MNAYQNRRLNQLIDKLVEHKITRPEYMEYKYLWELLRAESVKVNHSATEELQTNGHSVN